MPLRGWLALVVLVLAGGIGAVVAVGPTRTGGAPSGLEVYLQPGEAPMDGRPAPDLALALFSGETLHLGDLRGRPAVVAFWASWCGPCRQEAPVLARVWRDYRDRVAFVGVAVEDETSRARAYLQEFGLAFPAGLDGHGTLAQTFGVEGIPAKYFLDREGRLVRRFVGPIPEQTLRSLLDALLAP